MLRSHAAGASAEATVFAFCTPTSFEATKFAGAAHNAIHIMVDAIRRAGAADPEKIRDALEKTDYNGLVGNIKFDAKHQAYGQTVYLAHVKSGVPEVVEAKAEVTESTEVPLPSRRKSESLSPRPRAESNVT